MSAMKIDAPLTTPEPLKPRKYQRTGIDWLKKHKRGMLTDQAGLGKTLQAALASESPTLVSCPSYLTEQWYDFLCHQFPAQRVVLCTGTRFERQSALNTKADWHIINHEMMRLVDSGERSSNGYKLYKLDYDFKLPYRTMIIDESHHIRNHTAQKSKGAKILANKSSISNVFLLTATPIWKEPDDLFMQLHILWPDIFPSYWDFVNTWCNTINDGFGTKVVGIKRQKAKDLRTMLDTLRLGRRYSDVALQLPDLIPNEIKVSFTPEIQRAYDRLKYQYRLESHVLAHFGQVLRGLRQFTGCKEKIDATIELLEDIQYNAVIYVWYKDTADVLAQYLSSTKHKPVIISGETPPAQRATLARNSKLVIATIASLSEGVDLAQFKNVIFYEENWTPGSNYQAISRLRRWSKLGNVQEPVNVYYIHVRGTVDEVVHKYSLRRTATIKEVLRESLE